jgi:hypothetical protein
VQHWDGASWTRELAPTGGLDPSLSAVTISPAGSVWAVGATNRGARTFVTKGVR